RHIIVEGNYLLLDEVPWRELTFDTTVYLEVPLQEIERRLLKRWKALAGDDLKSKMEANDLPNARKVIERSRPAEFTLQNF
ncbi:MAG: nucleoside/nucleotide kinase family protein, partial [Pseudomonadota bacterium]